ncbi:MAG: hypothetical protein IJV89_09470 [Lentisphaeria bacterium]|nr:hypothetical protein [Lentisphaeria bacterium]
MRHEKSGVITKYSKIFVQKQVFCAIFSEKREAAVQRRQTRMRGAGGAHVKTVDFTEFSDKKLQFVLCRCILSAGFLPNVKGAYEFQNIFMGFIDRYFSAAGGGSAAEIPARSSGRQSPGLSPGTRHLSIRLSLI